MSRESVTALGRSRREEGMTETVRVYSGILSVGDDLKTSETTTQLYPDPSTGRDSGPGSLTSRSTVVSDRETVGQAIAVESRILSLPVGASLLVATDATAVILASTTSPGLVGRTFRITGEPDSAYTTANRYPVEQIS